METAYANLENAQASYDSAVAAIDNGTYEALSQYDATRQSAESARNSALDALNSANSALSARQSELSAAQAAYDQAVKALEDAQAAPNAEAEPTCLQDLQQAVDTAKAALDAAQAACNEAAAAQAQAQSAYDAADSSYQEACKIYDARKSDSLASLEQAIETANTNYETALASYDAAVLSSEQQLEGYAAALDKTQATANTAASQLELENLRDSLDDYTITAPCDGTITDLAIEVGSMASTSQAVATITDLKQMEISIKVDEYSILNTGEGQDVSIYIDSIGKTMDGTLTWVSDTATVENGVSYFEATVSFTADSDVRSGMSVEVRLTSADERDAVSVSAEAVRYRDDNTAYVMVQNEDGTTEQRDVTVGASDGSYVQITEGLSAGEVVLAEPSAGSASMGGMGMGGMGGIGAAPAMG